jgi:phosphatidylserine/phosphatidylglycerophosphate/cardiolipin synthase-like enzyme
LTKQFADKDVPAAQNWFMAGFPSHHQKMVVIDVESPEDHVGFLMGHNTLDEYWDTTGHSYFRKAENLGRNGKNPRQDISSRLTGPVVGDLYFNFKQAWDKTTHRTLSFWIKEGWGAASDAASALQPIGRNIADGASDAYAYVMNKIFKPSEEERRIAEQARRERDARRQQDELERQRQAQAKREWKQEDARIRREPLPQLTSGHFQNFPLYSSKLVACEGIDLTPQNVEKLKVGLPDITTGESGGAVVLRTHTHGKHFLDFLSGNKRDIRNTYLHVVNMATRYIYFENQFFRWPPLAEKIKEAALKQTGGGRDPARHGSLYVFVVTNSSEEGIGPGTLKTYQMLESLGRADAIPEVARTKRVEDLDMQIEIAEWHHNQALKASQDQRNRDRNNARTNPGYGKVNAGGVIVGDSQLAQKWQTLTANEAATKAKLDELKEKRDKLAGDDPIQPEDRPGLKIHVCTLVPPDTPDGLEWNEVYIHTKLMLINDTYMTLGSANVNNRSMEVDTELNIAHCKAKITLAARKELWAQHTGGRGAQDNMELAFLSWARIINENRDKEAIPIKPLASLRGFMRTDPKISSLD